jgi:hypothetical protein
MIDAMKVAVLYVKPGQTVLSDVFNNQPDPSHAFWKMMVCLILSFRSIPFCNVLFLPRRLHSHLMFRTS